MVTAGVGFFAGGSKRPATQNRSGKEPNGNTAVTDGRLLEVKEYVGGFWILDCANMDEAAAWGRKACVAWADAGRNSCLPRNAVRVTAKNLGNLVEIRFRRSLQ